MGLILRRACACSSEGKPEICYGGYPDVRKEGMQVMDSTESFFFAELLKYAYLVFNTTASDELLNNYVLTTEAHPMPILE